jgi:hypothetical protein
MANYCFAELIFQSRPRQTEWLLTGTMTHDGTASANLAGPELPSEWGKVRCLS